MSETFQSRYWPEHVRAFACAHDTRANRCVRVCTPLQITDPEAMGRASLSPAKRLRKKDAAKSTAFYLVISLLHVFDGKDVRTLEAIDNPVLKMAGMIWATRRNEEVSEDELKGEHGTRVGQSASRKA